MEQDKGEQGGWQVYILQVVGWDRISLINLRATEPTLGNTQTEGQQQSRWRKNCLHARGDHGQCPENNDEQGFNVAGSQLSQWLAGRLQGLKKPGEAEEDEG
jgi:hypothetical protein